MDEMLVQMNDMMNKLQEQQDKISLLEKDKSTGNKYKEGAPSEKDK